jgi:hypothetical protein
VDNELSDTQLWQLIVVLDELVRYRVQEAISHGYLAPLPDGVEHSPRLLASIGQFASGDIVGLMKRLHTE